METGVLHSDLSAARDLDSICVEEAMKCLTEYTLHPKFNNSAINVVFWMAKEHLSKLERSSQFFSKACPRFNLKYDVNRSLEEQERKDLKAKIEKLEVAAKPRDRQRTLERT